jgi:CDP-diacylglycerol--glycerol-3-phosphate 3-phosphatidyltransferase
MMNVWEESSLMTLAMGGVLSGAYAFRVAVKGAPTYERIERQGESFFLNKRIMAMGYWSMQPLSYLFIRLGVSATVVSWLAFALGISSGVLVSQGFFAQAAMAAGFSGILDAVDGMVARQTHTDSKAGKVLDSTLDRYVEFGMIAGMAYYFRGATIPFVLSLFALLGSFMVSYSTAIGEIAGIELRGGAMRRAERMVVLTLGIVFATVELPWVKSPLILSLLLVAVMANASAVRRTAAVRRILAARA